MKIVIYDWCRDCGPDRMAPYTHNHVIEVPEGRDLLEEALLLARVFYEKGLNVMLLHRPEGVLIGLDTKHFGQR